jgi:hypothetical protein
MVVEHNPFDRLRLGHVGTKEGMRHCCGIH